MRVRIRQWVQDPLIMRHVNGWSAIFWLAMVPVSWFLGWFSLVEYVSALSVYAIVVGHWSGWQSARVEVKQDEQNGGSSG